MFRLAIGSPQRRLPRSLQGSPQPDAGASGQHAGLSNTAGAHAADGAHATEAAAAGAQPAAQQEPPQRAAAGDGGGGSQQEQQPAPEQDSTAAGPSHAAAAAGTGDQATAQRGSAPSVRVLSPSDSLPAHLRVAAAAGLRRYELDSTQRAADGSRHAGSQDRSAIDGPSAPHARPASAAAPPPPPAAAGAQPSLAAAVVVSSDNEDPVRTHP